jgi:hypothetical protein
MSAACYIAFILICSKADRPVAVWGDDPSLRPQRPRVAAGPGKGDSQATVNLGSIMITLVCHAGGVSHGPLPSIRVHRLPLLPRTAPPPKLKQTPPTAAGRPPPSLLPPPLLPPPPSAAAVALLAYRVRRRRKAPF